MSAPRSAPRSERQAGLGVRLGRGLALAFLTAASLSLTELFLALATPSALAPDTALSLSALGLALLGALAAPAGLAAGLAAHLAAPRWARVRRAPTPPVGAGAARETRPTVRAQRLLWRALGLCLVLAALGGHALNATLYLRLYTDLHRLLVGVAALGLLVGYTLLAAPIGPPVAPPPTPPRRRPGLSLGLALLLALGAAGSGHVVLGQSRALRAAAFEHTTALAAALYVLSGGGRDDEDDRRAAVPLDAETLRRTRAELAPEDDAVPAAPAPRWNLLLLTIDALRWDRLHGGEEARLPLPNLRGLLARGLHFTRAYATSAWTLASLYGLLTSRLPSQLAWTPIGVSEDERIVVDPPRPPGLRGLFLQKHRSPAPLFDRSPTLASLLRQAGYLTATFPAYVFFLRNVGLSRDFEHNDSGPYHATRTGGRDGDAVIEERLSDFLWRHGRGELGARPFFAWAHLLEPHAPYRGPPSLPAAARHALALQSADARLGRLLATLEATGLSARTLVVVTGDHGEELGDHGGEYHGATLYEEVVRVPWLFAPPGGRPRRLDSPVSHLDLAPTLLALAGAPPPPTSLGRSLAPWLLGAPGEPPPRPVLAETSRFDARKRMLVEGRYKLVQDRRHDTRELYDLAADPGEKRNLIDAEAPRADAMAERLGRYLEVLAGDAVPTAP